MVHSVSDRSIAQPHVRLLPVTESDIAGCSSTKVHSALLCHAPLQAEWLLRGSSLARWVRGMIYRGTFLRLRIGIIWCVLSECDSSHAMSLVLCVSFLFCIFSALFAHIYFMVVSRLSPALGLVLLVQQCG